MKHEEKEWIGVDLDSTLARYDGWISETYIGPPVLEMVRRVKAWIQQGERVKIFTARVATKDTELKQAITFAINLWCIDHIGKLLEVTNEKDYLMKEMWDDQCVHVEANTGKILG